MDNGLNWEQKTLINELSQGMELAKQLRFHLNSTSSAESRQLLLQKILSSYEKALLILNWSGSVGQPQSSAEPTTGVPESCISGDGSPRSEDRNMGFKDHQDQTVVFKKRKVLPTWTDQVRVCSQNGLEGPIDDGYSWRKYGQKDILGAKYPRSYYRCTYRNVQNCWATKQVQRSDDDPTVFEIIYRGRHECNQSPHAAPPPPSLDKQETKQNHHHQQHPPNNKLFNFRTSLTVDTEDLDGKEMTSHFTFPNQNFPLSEHVHDNILDGFSPSFLSPTVAETNYLWMPPCEMINSFGVVYDMELSESEIISANTSATNSPIVDLDNFSIDPVDLDQNFPFGTPGFFN